MGDEMLPLPELLRRRALEHGERTLLTDAGGRTLTYAGAHEEALRWTTVLTSLGLVEGDRVLTMHTHDSVSLPLWIGIAWAGGVEVPISVLYQGSLLAHVVRTADPSVIVIDRDLAPRLAELGDVLEHVGAVVVLGDDGAEPPLGPDIRYHRASDLLARSAPAEVTRTLEVWQPGGVLFTSGTTGPSKGVVVPWAQITSTATGMLPREDLGPDDVFYLPSATNHIGAKCIPHLMISVGGSLVVSQAFSRDRFWADIQAHSITTTALIGAMAHQLLALPPQPGDSDTSLRNVMMAPVPPDVAQFNARFGTRVFACYNMTEISVPLRWPTWDALDPASCGTLREGYPGYECRLVDEHDREVPVGQVGELIVRTSVPWTLNSGYLGAPEATATAWRNGWFHTGDAMRRDEEGRYYFVDRFKDSIRRNGENISSFEIEADVNSHPDVVESAAIAVPARLAEDDIKVFVVLRDGAQLAEEDLIEFLRDKMAKFAIPRFVEFIDELPKTPTLRVQKAQLRGRDRSREWDRFAGRDRDAPAPANALTSAEENS